MCNSAFVVQRALVTSGSKSFVREDIGGKEDRLTTERAIKAEPLRGVQGHGRQADSSDDGHACGSSEGAVGTDAGCDDAKSASEHTKEKGEPDRGRCRVHEDEIHRGAHGARRKADNDEKCLRHRRGHDQGRSGQRRKDSGDGGAGPVRGPHGHQRCEDGVRETSRTDIRTDCTRTQGLCEMGPDKQKEAFIRAGPVYPTLPQEQVHNRSSRKEQGGADCAQGRVGKERGYEETARKDCGQDNDRYLDVKHLVSDQREGLAGRREEPRELGEHGNLLQQADRRGRRPYGGGKAVSNTADNHACGQEYAGDHQKAPGGHADRQHGLPVVFAVCQA